MMRVHVVSKSNPTDRSIVWIDTKNNWDSLTEEHFLTPAEVVLDLCLNVSKEDCEWIKTMPEAHLIRLHHTVGQHIRNTYGLWHPQNPQIVEGDLGDHHPDGISMRIIELFHEYLNDSRSEAYVNAMSILTQEK